MMDYTMKIAVAINGLYRPHVQPDPRKCHWKLQTAFPTADFFYHTWEQYEQDIPLDFRHKLEMCPEPKMDYHGISGHKEQSKHGKWQPYVEKRFHYEKHKGSHKQILGFSDLFTKIPEEYDIIVRARWDTHINTKINWDEYAERAYNEGPLGFMVRPTRGAQMTDRTVTEIPKDITDTRNDWFWYLPDVLMILHRKWFDPKIVWDLHERKALWGAEWGWFQVLSLPHGENGNHTSFLGGAQIAR